MARPKLERKSQPPRSNSIQFKGIPENLSKSEQDNAVALLVMSEKYCKEAMDLIAPELFSNIVIRDIVRKAHEYIGRHGKPPGQHIADLMKKKLHGDDEDEAELYREAISNIDMVWTEAFNEEYVRETLTHFAALQEMKLVTTNLIEAAEAGDLDHGLEAIAKGAANKEAYEKGMGYGVQLITASTITPKEIDWAWSDWLARGKFSILSGPKGSSKTTILMHLVAAMTNPRRVHMPDGTRVEGGGGIALIWSGEDDIDDTLVPRLIAAHADLDRVRFIGGIKKGGVARTFNPASDMPELLRAANNVSLPIALLGLDSVVSVMPEKRSSHNNAETRLSLQPCVDLTRAVHCVTVGISHVTREFLQSGNPAKIGSIGSVAWDNVARTVLYALPLSAPTQDAKGGTLADAILIRGQSNISKPGASILYRREMTENRVLRLRWGEEKAAATHDLIAFATGKQREAVEAFLRDALANGKREREQLFKDADKAGFDKNQLYAARERLGIRMKQEGFQGRSYWSLPEASES